MNARKKIVISLTLVGFFSAAHAQKQITITIDDAPAMTWSDKTPITVIDEANGRLLKVISKHQIPVTVFVNEKGLANAKDKDARIKILKQWLLHPLVTAGNHSYSHLNYAETSPEVFQQDILQGEALSRKILAGTGKSLTYFRFPFNALGKDSLSVVFMQQFLTSKGYQNTPFTIESSDYLFNELYQQALDKHNAVEAKRIAQAYIAHTLELLDHFEKLSQQHYNRSIPQIYLCHDNALNADYLQELVERIKANDYTFIDLATTLEDKAYQQTDYYYGPYGFSWFYRWEKNPQERKKLLQQQPEPASEFYQAYLQALKRVR